MSQKPQNQLQQRNIVVGKTQSRAELYNQKRLEERQKNAQNTSIPSKAKLITPKQQADAVKKHMVVKYANKRQKFLQEKISQFSDKVQVHVSFSLFQDVKAILDDSTTSAFSSLIRDSEFKVLKIMPIAEEKMLARDEKIAEVRKKYNLMLLNHPALRITFEKKLLEDPWKCDLEMEEWKKQAPEVEDASMKHIKLEDDQKHNERIKSIGKLNFEKKERIEKLEKKFKFKQDIKFAIIDTQPNKEQFKKLFAPSPKQKQTFVTQPASKLTQNNSFQKVELKKINPKQQTNVYSNYNSTFQQRSHSQAVGVGKAKPLTSQSIEVKGPQGAQKLNADLGRQGGVTTGEKTHRSNGDDSPNGKEPNRRRLVNGVIVEKPYSQKERSTESQRTIPLYKRFEEQYNEKILLPELMKRKKLLQERRNKLNVVQWSKVKEHEKDYIKYKKQNESLDKDFSKENKKRLNKTTQSSSSSEAESSSQESSQSSHRVKKVQSSKSHYHQSVFYKKLQEEERKKQVLERIEMNKKHQIMKNKQNYSKMVSEVYRPRASPAKRNLMEQNLLQNINQGKVRKVGRNGEREEITSLPQLNLATRIRTSQNPYEPENTDSYTKKSDFRTVNSDQKPSYALQGIKKVNHFQPRKRKVSEEKAVNASVDWLKERRMERQERDRERDGSYLGITNDRVDIEETRKGIQKDILAAETDQSTKVHTVLAKAHHLEENARRMEQKMRAANDPSEIAGASRDISQLYLTSIETKLAMLKNL